MRMAGYGLQDIALITRHKDPGVTMVFHPNRIEVRRSTNAQHPCAHMVM